MTDLDPWFTVQMYPVITDVVIHCNPNARIVFVDDAGFEIEEWPKRRSAHRPHNFLRTMSEAQRNLMSDLVAGTVILNTTTGEINVYDQNCFWREYAQKELQPPKMTPPLQHLTTLVRDIRTPEAGTMIINSDTNRPNLFDGTTWHYIGAPTQEDPAT